MNKEIFKKYWQYAGLLEDNEMSALVQYHLYGWDIKKIAKDLKISERAVRASKHTGLTKLEQSYKRYNGWDIAIDEDGNVTAFDPKPVKLQSRYMA